MRLAVVLACLAAPAPARAATAVATEVTAARLLRGAFVTQGAGARPVGMGEAFTAVADDASGISWNPGGLGQLGGLNAVVMHDAVAGGIGFSYAAAAYEAGTGTVALALSALSFGTYDVRDEAGVAQGVKNVTDVALTGGWGFRNPALLGLPGWTGLSIEYVTETVGRPMVGVGLGGVSPVTPGFSLGWAVLRLGPRDATFALPAVAKLGAAYHRPGLVRVALDLGYPLVDRDAWVALGAEAFPVPQIAVRAGYKWRSRDSALGGVTGLTAGVGFRAGRFGLDYAFQPFGELAQSHRVALAYGLGAAPARAPERAAAAARASPGRARKPGKVETAYAKALERHKAGDHDGALVQVTAALKANRRHWQSWQLLGNLRYAKGDRKGARSAYLNSLKLHPDNPSLKQWVDRLPVD